MLLIQVIKDLLRLAKAVLTVRRCPQRVERFLYNLSAMCLYGHRTLTETELSANSNTWEISRENLHSAVRLTFWKAGGSRLLEPPRGCPFFGAHALGFTSEHKSYSWQASKWRKLGLRRSGF